MLLILKMQKTLAKNDYIWYTSKSFVGKYIYVCLLMINGWIPEWPKGTDCKSAGTAFEGSNPSPPILHSTDLLAVKQYLGCAKYMLCIKIQKSRCGGTGRRTGLKILRDLYSHTGSIPVAGTM